MSDVLSAPDLRRSPIRPELRRPAAPAGLLGLHVANPIPCIDPEPVLAEPAGPAGRIALIALRLTVFAVMAACAVAFGMTLSRGLLWLAGLDG